MRDLQPLELTWLHEIHHCLYEHCPRVIQYEGTSWLPQGSVLCFWKLPLHMLKLTPQWTSIHLSVQDRILRRKLLQPKHLESDAHSQRWFWAKIKFEMNLTFNDMETQLWLANSLPFVISSSVWQIWIASNFIVARWLITCTSHLNTTAIKPFYTSNHWNRNPILVQSHWWTNERSRAGGSQRETRKSIQPHPQWLNLQNICEHPKDVQALIERLH